MKNLAENGGDKEERMIMQCHPKEDKCDGAQLILIESTT
jgi:hypothetical protein